MSVISVVRVSICVFEYVCTYSQQNTAQNLVETGEVHPPHQMARGRRENKGGENKKAKNLFK